MPTISDVDAALAKLPNLPQRSGIGNLLVKVGLEDLDGVSLYPSAMDRIPGYLKGAPKVWCPGIILSEVDGYFLEIKSHRLVKNISSQSVV